MTFSIDQIIDIIGSNYDGDTSFKIKGVSSFEDAGPSDITFACDTKFLGRIDETKAIVIIIPLDFDSKAIPNKILLKGDCVD